MLLHARLAAPTRLLFPALLAIAIAGAGGCAVVSSEGQPSPLSDGSGSVEGGGEPAFGDASACRPGDVATYQPPAYLSATAAWQGVCLVQAGGSDPIQGFYDVCFGPKASPAACMVFKTDPGTKACAACVLTADSKGHYGPLIDHGGFITTNVAGCLELTDPSGLSCAKALQALQGCELTACQANCPVHDSASRTAYDTCASLADRVGCQSYRSAAACLDAEKDSGLVANCLIPSFTDFYHAVVPLFCGAPPPHADAGAPFPIDASQDASSDSIVDATEAVSDATVADAPTDSRPDAPADARAVDALTDVRADGARE
jgi:hypothetical protein